MGKIDDRPDGPADGGVRARNRERNRAELIDAALRLVEARGFDAVTVDDIVAEAGISRRTFFRYFESKEDAVLPGERERLEAFRAVLRDRPADQPFLSAVREAVRTVVAPSTVDREESLRRWRIIHQNPSVRIRAMELQLGHEELLRDALAEYLGLDPETSVAPRVLAAGTFATVRAAAEAWLASDGSRELVDLLEEATEVLLRGLAPGMGDLGTNGANGERADHTGASTRSNGDRDAG